MKWLYRSREEIERNIAVCALDAIGRITEAATDASAVPLIEGVRITVNAILDSIREDREKEDGADDEGGED